MFSHEGYHGLRQGAAVVRRDDRGLLEVSGTDRLTWLQGLVTNDVSALPIGGICDAAYLTPQGRMVTDLRVINLAERALLDVPASLAQGLAEKLDGLLFAEDAQITNVSHRTRIIDVHGPDAESILDRLDGELRPMTDARLRDPAFGVPGISLLASAANADAVVFRLVTAGAIETSLETLDVVRVEAGRPAFLVDMDEHTIPLEAGLEDRAISFTKGCYVGQEVIVRVMHRGQGRVAKKLVGLTLENGILPQAGDAIRSGNREVGRVTSAVWSPALERGLVLGYVHRDFVESGTALTISSRLGVVSAIVSSLPFVTR